MNRELKYRFGGGAVSSILFVVGLWIFGVQLERSSAAFCFYILFILSAAIGQQIGAVIESQKTLDEMMK